VRVGQADWSASDGAIQASHGSGPAHLVTRETYKGFALRVEFWSSDDANIGVFFRCQDLAVVNETGCYEANIFDQRPDQTCGTGAIVGVAPVARPAARAGGRWNTLEITAQGTNLVLVLNGQKTVDLHDAKLASGPFASQRGRGTVKFREVEMRAL
jgi:hypothetical protein